MRYNSRTRKTVVIAIIYTWIPFLGHPGWGQAPSVGKHITQNPKQKANFASSQPQIGTEASPFVVETHPRPKSEKEAADAKADENHATRIERWMLFFTGAAAFFTGLLVWVGWRGVKAAVRTLRAIEKQAALQAASMTQWVSVSKWRVNIAERSSPLSQQPKALSVDFEVLNESNFPLAMQASFRFFGRMPNGTTLHNPTSINLFPRKPYKMSLILNLTEDLADDYMGVNGLRISVHGQILHVGVAKEQSPLMTIKGNLVCGDDIVEPYLEFESIRLIPIDPAPKRGVFYCLNRWWAKHDPKKNNQEPN